MAMKFSEGQNAALGVFSACICGVIFQPTLYWKNARAQRLPLSCDLRVVYRGTGMSLLNEMQLLGLQMSLTRLYRRLCGATDSHCVVSAGLGGVTGAILATPIELIMIQQQLHGHNALSTIATMAREHGIRGYFRGLVPAMMRDGCYVAGLLSTVPLLQQHFLEQQIVPFTSTTASFAAACTSGILLSAVSYPMDVIKTCLQGDPHKKIYSTALATMRQVY